MKDKTLKKLKRAELLELLLEQRRINEQLEKELAEAKEQLEDKRIRIEGAGNLAEASLALTEVFREAQRAADLYLENIKLQAQAPDEPVITEPVAAAKSVTKGEADDQEQADEAIEPSEKLKEAASAISSAFEALNEVTADPEAATEE